MVVGGHPTHKRGVKVAGAGIVAGLSVLLSFWKIFTLPQGGSVSLETLPLILAACVWGTRAGVAAGVVSGLLQLILGGFVVHPLQAILDYPVAFGLIGLAGVTRNVWLGILIGSAGRLVAHFLAGIIFFGSYAPAGQPVWLYSLLYNGSIVLSQVILAALLVPVLVRRLRAAGVG